MSTPASVPGGSQNNVYGGSRNNVRGSGIPSTFPALPGLSIQFNQAAIGLFTPPNNMGFSNDYSTNPAPGSNALGGDPLRNVNLLPIASFGTGPDTGVSYPKSEWQYQVGYTPDPLPFVGSPETYNSGPAGLVISQSDYYPPFERYLGIFTFDIQIGTTQNFALWGGNVQCYISTHNDGTHLVAIGPSITPPALWAARSSVLPVSFRFNPILLLGNAPFYAAIQFAGLPYVFGGSAHGVSLNLKYA